MKNPAKPNVAGPSTGLSSEYRFAYAKVKANRFAGRPHVCAVVVVLAPDVAEVFRDAESVNAGLRSIVKALPGTFTSSTETRPPFVPTS